MSPFLNSSPISNLELLIIEIPLTSEIMFILFVAEIRPEKSIKGKISFFSINEHVIIEETGESGKQGQRKGKGKERNQRI